MYVTGNPKTKKALREALQRGETLTIFAPGLGTPKENGVENVEGPHYPEPHRWYGVGTMHQGMLIKVK